MTSQSETIHKTKWNDEALECCRPGSLFTGGVSVSKPLGQSAVQDDCEQALRNLQFTVPVCFADPRAEDLVLCPRVPRLRSTQPDFGSETKLFPC